ncbi:rhodanese-like domain-containing protein [Candidatus Protochlamydia phocaeensis]|uniref:rhodanese-like domain-containing protein n=1 Tax=Candidatus Protochlamydia phocaeensis TaxID=1414722 RepID=UPI0008388884|nr:rhodanese-like domain-containing protein [Candidatus Protochlamydia phocaeensis]
MLKTKTLLVATFLTHGFLYAQDSSQPHIIDPTVQKKYEKLAQSYKIIHTNEFKNLLKKPSLITVVDARPSDDDDGKRIPGAKSVPFDANEETIKGALPSKEAAIVVYCTDKECPISEIMAERLIKMGYTHVLRYIDGVEGWEAEGNKVSMANGIKAKGSKSE